MILDLIVRNANLDNGKNLTDIAVKDGRIVEVAPQINAGAMEEIDAEGMLAVPPFVDSHFHLDAARTLGIPRLNMSGTLLEGIELWGELKPDLTPGAIKERALSLLKWSIAKGTLAVRTHVDICDPSLMAVDVLLEVKREMAPYMDIQLVAFPQDGYLRSKGAKALLVEALNRGVDVVGGIPHFERTMEGGAESIRSLCEIAADRGLLVDMHCDESDDPLSRHVETLAAETVRTGLTGRVAGSHLTSMHSMDNYYVSKLLPLMKEAGLSAVCNPLINLTLQGRHDTYPKRRGLTRVPEMLDAGINVSLGHDCVMDPWYPLGTHDMIEVAHMGVHALQMTGVKQMQNLFDSVTARGARTLHLDGYGIEAGCNADFVILQARDRIEALRTKPPRLYVVRKGKIVAETPPLKTRITLGDEDSEVNFLS